MSLNILIYYKASHITEIFVSSGNNKDEERKTQRRVKNVANSVKL